jgi:hypothetical protein
MVPHMQKKRKKKKKGANFFYVESWQWHLTNNKRKPKGKREQVVFPFRIGDGVTKTTKKTKNQDLAMAPKN